MPTATAARMMATSDSLRSISDKLSSEKPIRTSRDALLAVLAEGLAEDCVCVRRPSAINIFRDRRRLQLIQNLSRLSGTGTSTSRSLLVSGR